MTEKIKIVYNIRVADKNSDLFGILIEKSKTFNSLHDAMLFVRDANSGIVGKPILEKK